MFLKTVSRFPRHTKEVSSNVLYDIMRYQIHE